MNDLPCDPVYVLKQYEALRQEALTERPRGLQGKGLAVLMNRGLPGWLSALTALAPAPAPGPSCTEGLPTAGPRWVPAARTELTSVLAGMVLACIPTPEVS